MRRHVTLAEALRNAGHWRIDRGKRMHVRAAIERQRVSCQPLASDGKAFEQELSAGRVWALTGTLGSGKDER